MKTTNTPNKGIRPAPGKRRRAQKRPRAHQSSRTPVPPAFANQQARAAIVRFFEIVAEWDRAAAAPDVAAPEPGEREP